MPNGQPRRSPAPPCPLSPRQLETLTLIARGATEKEAARRLGISPFTVGHHLAAAREQLGAAHTAHAVALAIKLKLIEV
jgi:DNA-binding CsgD family transcriptional regulator